MSPKRNLVDSFARFSLMVSCWLLPAQAGTIFEKLGVQAHRDFAENRGIFDINAINIEVKDINGNVIGVIERMANFDGLADAHIGEASLAGGQGFIATVAHDYNNPSLTFTRRFGAQGTVFDDVYRTISIENAWENQVNNYTYDYRVQRLNKIVTEAVASAYCVDPEVIDNIPAHLVQRAGAGLFKVQAEDGTIRVHAGGYAMLHGGIVSIQGQLIQLPPGTPLPPPETWPKGVRYTNLAPSSLDAAKYPVYVFDWYLQDPNEANPFPISALGGDSGSPAYVYNPNSGRWEFAAALQSGAFKTSPTAPNDYSQLKGSNQWAIARIESYDRLIEPVDGGGDLVLTGPEVGATQASLVQGGTTWNFTTLAADKRGATSKVSANGTTTGEADNASLLATHNLILGEGGGTISLANSVDLGAGSITFRGNYRLTNGGDATRRLNSAGFVIDQGYRVDTELTGIAGDEWRVMGDGVFAVGGEGDNGAALNVGGHTVVLLNRSGGKAASSIKINGGQAYVWLADEGQLVGDDSVLFGHRGGTLDLNGTNRSFGKIVHLDNGASIANYTENTVSEVTIGGTGVSQTYLGSFFDDGKTNAILNVKVQGANASEVWTLRGYNDLAGKFSLNQGGVVIEGEQVIHAGGVKFDNDYTVANFRVGSLDIASGTNFTVSKYANVTSAGEVLVNGALTLKTGGKYVSPVTNLANAEARLIAAFDDQQTVASKLIGSGGVEKTGKGTLTLNGANTFTGESRIVGGAVAVSSAQALGGGSGNWQIAEGGVLVSRDLTFGALKSKINTASTGTFALDSTSSEISPDQAPDLSGYGGLYLGALDRVEVGTLGTDQLLTAWATGGGWNLGGGGGELVMHRKLSGSGTLRIGNGNNQGVVTLTNIHNSDTVGGAAFSGQIEIRDGVELRYTDVRVLGAVSGNLFLDYGTSMAIGNGLESQLGLNQVRGDSRGVVMVRDGNVENYDFSGRGLHDLYLGADGDATYSGTITAGSKGYQFGGRGKLTVASALSGNHQLTVDTQDLALPSGVVSLTNENTYTGGTTVRENSTLQIGNGGETGSILSTVANSGRVLYNRSNDYEIANLVTGTGDVTKLGAGKASLISNWNRTVKTTIEEGTLSLGNGVVNGSVGTGEIVNLSQLEVNYAGNGTLANVVSGTGDVTYAGSGKTQVAGKNTYTGKTVIANGVVIANSDSAFGAKNTSASKIIVRPGGQLDVNGVGNLGSGVTIEGDGGDGQGAIVNQSKHIGTNWSQITNLTLSGNASIGGSYDHGMIAPGYGATLLDLAGNTLTKKGANTITFGNASATAGRVNIEAGTLQHFNGAVTDFSQVAVNVSAGANYNAGNIAGILLRVGNLEGSGNMQLGLASLSVGGRNEDGRFEGAISGSGTLAKEGSGTWTIAGTSTHTGASKVSGGTLELDYRQQNDTKLGDAGVLTFENNSRLLLTGGSHVEKVASTTVNGVGTVERNGGTSRLDLGLLSFGANGTLKVSEEMFAFTQTENNANGMLENVRFSDGLYASRDTAGNIIVFTNYDNVTRLSSGSKGIVGGAASYVRILDGTGAAGNIGLAATGATQVTSVMNSARGGVSTVNVASGQTLRVKDELYGTNDSSQWNVVGQGVITQGEAENTTGALNVRQFGEGEMKIGSRIVNNGTGVTSLNKEGSGRVVLAGNNSYTGTTTIQEGVLQVGEGGSAGNLGSGEVINSGVLEISRGDNVTFTNVISGTGDVKIRNSGAGATTLMANNRFRGSIYVEDGGRLKIGSTNALGSWNTNVSKVYVRAGSTLDVGGTDTTQYGYTIEGNGTDGLGALVNTGNSTRTNQFQNQNIALSGDASIGGTGNFGIAASANGPSSLDLAGHTLTKQGTNTLYLSNTTVTAGTIQLNRGKIEQLTGSNLSATRVVFGTQTAAILDSGANDLQLGSLSGGSGAFGDVMLGSGRTLTVGGLNQNDTFSGYLNGYGTFRKIGTGVQTLTADNSYFFGSTTYVSGGELRAGGTGAFGTGRVYVESGATLNVGTALTNFQHGNRVFVQDGGTLKGIARMNNEIMVEAGGTFSPGNSPGVVNLSGRTTTFSANSTYLWEITGMNPMTAGTDYDQLFLTNGATLDLAQGALLSISGLDIDYTSEYWGQNRSFTAVGNNGSGAILGLFELDTTKAGNFESRGTWGLMKQGDQVFTTWTVVPEPSSALFVLLGASALGLRRRRVG